jgi:hypothetical protein
MSVFTYNSASVSLIVGAKLISGFADDSFVTVEQMNDSWSDMAGTDGFVTRSYNTDKRGTVTITLSQSSPSNDDLMAMLTADELTGAGALPLLLRDASGSTVCSAASSWIVKPAQVEFGRNVTNRQWQIRCAVLSMFVGGNASS